MLCILIFAFKLALSVVFKLFNSDPFSKQPIFSQEKRDITTFARSILEAVDRLGNRFDNFFNFLQSNFLFVVKAMLLAF